jgi:arginyl-tRNA synthetase
MYQPLEQKIRDAIRDHIATQYHLDATVTTERPPKLEMGELASPVCFDLAKRMKRPPRLLAQEIAVALGPVMARLPGVARIEVAGGGYLNVFFDRPAFFREAFAHQARGSSENLTPSHQIGESAPKTIVEHTCINPNKAAHIGHLRNAVLGDTFARLLRHSGHHVEVQNYIDNTGVQVADVVLGFLHIEKKSAAEIRDLVAGPQFDYYCWDLYARVTHYLEEDPARLALRSQVLKDIEHGQAPAADLAELISTAIVHCHLRTLDRLGIEYDLLPRESEILRLNFWDVAFALLKERGAIHLAASGKNVGCWVMLTPTGADSASQANAEHGAEEEGLDVTTATFPAPDNSAEAEAKIIVRSNGTVTYVGKDIAYHLWKFGLLARDFYYQHFHAHPSGHVDWITNDSASDLDAPVFGRARRVYNVIDSRQSYPQMVVKHGLRTLGFPAEADSLTHLAYDVVALTPRCAAEMGYEIPPEDANRPFVEVSGRKGQGVKADDLLDQLEALARAEVDSRHPEASPAERAAVGHAIAIGSLRYFLLRFTRTTIIAFDFKEALSFEGETGPYVQYASVRARSIFRKLAEQNPGATIATLENLLTDEALGKILAPPDGNDLWSLTLLAGSLGVHVDAALKAQEPAFVAKYAFQLAQAFNLFYHRHRILSEENTERQAFLLLLADLVLRQLTIALNLLGMEAPEMM